VRPVERLDLVEAIAHGPRFRAATVLTFSTSHQPARGGYVATQGALAPSHYTITPFSIASLTIQHFSSSLFYRTLP
jgi:hypothetical protein